MIAAEPFQPFPHGFVYAAVGSLVGWVVLVAGLATRSLRRRSLGSLPGLAVLVLAAPLAKQRPAVAGITAAAVVVMTVRHYSTLALQERGGWSRRYLAGWLADHPTATVVLGIELLLAHHLLINPVGRTWAAATTVIVVIGSAVARQRQRRAAHAAVTRALGCATTPVARITSVYRPRPRPSPHIGEAVPSPRRVRRVAR